MTKSKQSILDSSIFGNKYILCRDSFFLISSFCKSNIKTVRDISNAETNAFQETEYIRNKLLDKTGCNAKYNKIKSIFFF